MQSSANHTCTACGRLLPKAEHSQLTECSSRILDFILKQPVPVSLPKLNKLFWKDCKPPLDMDACIQYIVDSEQVVRSVYTEGEGDNQRITTILASPEAMSEFVMRMQPQVPPKIKAIISPKRKILNYIQANIPNPYRNDLLELIEKTI